MKNLILLFIFLTAFIKVDNTTRHNNNNNNNNISELAGVIIYKHKANEISEELKAKRDNIFSELEKQASEIRFYLKFKENESFFEIETSMEHDKKPIAISYANAIISKGRYYTNLKDDVIIREYNALGEKFLISDKISDSIEDWKLTKETKMIDDFLCYKAIKQKTIENSLKTTNFDIVAWYCPQLPARFGPKDYNNLPGLILELKDTHFTFYVEKIQILNKEEVKLERLKGETISKKEFQKKILDISGQIIKN